MNASPVRRWLGFLALVAVAVVAMGCGPHWQVISQTVPSPLVNQRQFFIEAVRAENIAVGDTTEAVYLASKTPEQQASWQTDKTDMITHFSDGLMAEGEGLLFPTQPGPTTFIVRPIVLFVEPGFYAYVGKATELEMRVEILSPSGQPVDVIQVHSVIPAGMFNPATGTRLRQAADDAGHTTGDYLKSRVFR
jgi:hypothetical protein